MRAISVLFKVKNYLKSLKKINFKDTTKKILACDALLFCHDVDRGISRNNKAYSPLLDSLKEQIEDAGYLCTSIAHPWSEIVGETAYGSPISINRSYLIAKILDKLLASFEYKASVKLYERIITKSKAKVVLTIGCNNQLCEAARNLGVFHVELLHGIGYTPIPWGWESKDKIHLPQAILSLDPVSTNTFAELKKHNVIVKEIPHPFLSRFQKNSSQAIPSEWLPKKAAIQYKKEILVSLQWGYLPNVDECDIFKGYLPNGLFYEELKEVIRLTKDSVFWRFRFHPVQYRQPKKYEELFTLMDKLVNENKNCDWRDSTYIPLPGLLLQCAGHITMSSMTSYEAAYMGKQTLTLCPSLRTNGVYEDFFEDLVDLGYVEKKQVSVDAVLDWIDRVGCMKPLLNNCEIDEKLFDWLFINN